MNLFTQNPDFYPTPDALINRMLAEVPVAGKVILEPSAGKGDIVRRLLAAGAKEVLACEIDPSLRSILVAGQSDDRFALLANDFLNVRSEDISHVHAIVMNPPFGDAANHILHAWEIAPDGCDIVALCNADSFEDNWRNAWKQLRYVASINGEMQRIENAFTDAERRTDVAVTLLRLHKPADEEDIFADYFLSDEQDIAEGGNTAGLMPYNAIRDIVNRYVEACRLFKDVDTMAKKINDIAQYPGEDFQHFNPPIRFLAVGENVYERVTFDTYRLRLQKYYWEVIFRKLNLERYSTQKLRDDLNKFIAETKDKPFTMRNIYAVLDVIIQTNGQRMERSLVEAFEQICSFSADNSSAGEKWKTNADYMVNRRFIVPWMCEGRSYGFDHPTVSFSFGGERKLDDIVKVLCYLTGRSYESIPPLYSLTGSQWGQWYTWGFFRIRCYKKGTVHCEFLDEDVWYRFNAEVARIKGWALPRRTSQNKKRA